MGLFDNLSDYEIILASGSPRRRELLAMLGFDFKVNPLKDVDESYPDNIMPQDVPLYLARKKCQAGLAGLSGRSMIITADTVVVCEGRVLGKPDGEEDAMRMLTTLSGKKHMVVTGVSVATAEKQLSASATTEVEFAELTPDVMREYVTRYRPYDKAGAYGIQEWIGAVGIKGISGSFYNVMGLPLHLLTNLLLQF